MKLSSRVQRNIRGYGFMSPFLLLFFIFSVLPVLISIALSFTDYNMMESPLIVGLDNYKNLFLNDQEFILALKNTFVFAFISGPISSHCIFACLLCTFDNERCCFECGLALLFLVGLLWTYKQHSYENRHSFQAYTVDT